VRVEHTGSASGIVRHLIDTQQHHDPTDDADALRERFARGLVRLDDGTRLSPTSVVPAGQFIWFYRRPAPERVVPGILHELYRDDNLLVVDKPPFMSTLPRGMHITQTAVVRARREFGIESLSPAHRLDRLTSGVLLFTIKPSVRGAYQRLFEARQVVKTYEAVTPVPKGWSTESESSGMPDTFDSGLFEVPAGALGDGSPATVLDAPTAENPWVLRHRMIKLRGRMATYLESGEPNSETRVTGIQLRRGGTDNTGNGEDTVVWTLEPHSGRTHQLRVNMRLFGVPIVNDPLYGPLSDEALWNVDAAMPFVPAVADEDFGYPMGLTASAMDFTDPLSGRPRYFRR
jgi:tRNA pseudouridine32 synthase/23S rRNA pseudouridine746 synthase